MNAPQQFPLNDDVMHGRHVVAMLPLSRKDRTKYVFDVLKAAKERWNLTIDVVCQVTDRAPFQDLVAPNGKLYSPPHLLKPMAWEADPAQEAQVHRHIREAELAYKMPLGRNILAAGHSIGRGFNLSLRYSNRYPLVQKVTQENEEPFRIMRRLFVFAEETLNDARPDFIFSFDWATPLHSAFWMAANVRGIPAITIRNSKIHSNRAFWTADRLLLNTPALSRADEIRASGQLLTDGGRDYLRAFREKPRTIEYIAAKWRDRMKRGFVRWHLEYARTMVREIVNSFRGQDRSLRERGIVRLYRYYRGLYLFYTQKRFFHVLDIETLAKTKYVYFPMHKEAELAQTFQATPWHDQRNTIRLIASMLPAGYRLLAREHRLNYGLRPTRICKDLYHLPNVTLIDAFDSQFKYIKHADLVITENGSTGWEALLLGRRLITLSRTFYDGTGLGTKVWDPEELNRAIIDILSKPPVADAGEHDRALGAMVDAEMENTFPNSEAGRPQALDLLARLLGPMLRRAEAAPRLAANS